MNILFISDIVGRPGRDTVSKYLKSCIKEHKIDFVIANGENSAGGLGITPDIFKELIKHDINVITTGNHIWKRKEVFEIIEHPNLLRPANYPLSSPGKGYNIYEMPQTKIAVINLQGRIFMNPIDSPFSVVDKILDKLNSITTIIVDVHAEATSEKLALGWYLDGRVSAVIGTHTHIQTSDARILTEGTAYITDAGMTGSTNGVIGVMKEEIIKSFLTGMPFSYKGCKGLNYFQAVVIEVDINTGKAERIFTISEKIE